jgi:hypothetical protein
MESTQYFKSIINIFTCLNIIQTEQLINNTKLNEKFDENKYHILQDNMI